MFSLWFSYCVLFCFFLMHSWVNLLRSAISFERQSFPTYDQAWFLLGLNVFTKIKAAEVGSCFCSMPGSSDFIKRAFKVGIDNKPPMQLVVEVIKLHKLARFFCFFQKTSVDFLSKLKQPPMWFLYFLSDMDLLHIGHYLLSFSE